MAAINTSRLPDPADIADFSRFAVQLERRCRRINFDSTASAISSNPRDENDALSS